MMRLHVSFLYWSIRKNITKFVTLHSEHYKITPVKGVGGLSSLE